MMEESYRSDTPSSTPDPVSPESFTIGLTRSNSGASSLTVENCDDTLPQSGNASTDKHTGWTNQKHNTFLNCLEASFINQLHRSMASRVACVELNTTCRNVSEKLSVNVIKASEQVTVPRDGCWKKINNSKSDQPVGPVAVDSHHCLKHPWSDEYHHLLDIKLCRKLHRKEKRTRDKMPLSCLEARSLILQRPAEPWKTVGRITEGSGQNFEDGGFEENSSCKKAKTAMADTTDQD